MKLIIWLWNPGIKYESTRHNIWFMFLDWLKTELNISNDFRLESKFQAEILEFIWNGEKTFLVKPHTFMNLSWESVLKLMSFYKITKENIEAQVYYGRISENGTVDDITIIPMELEDSDEETRAYTYKAKVNLVNGGNYGYTFRVMPKHEMILDSANLNLIKWITKE